MNAEQLVRRAAATHLYAEQLIALAVELKCVDDRVFDEAIEQAFLAYEAHALLVLFTSAVTHTVAHRLVALESLSLSRDTDALALPGTAAVAGPQRRLSPAQVARVARLLPAAPEVVLSAVSTLTWDDAVAVGLDLVNAQLLPERDLAALLVYLVSRRPGERPLPPALLDTIFAACSDDWRVQRAQPSYMALEWLLHEDHPLPFVRPFADPALGQLWTDLICAEIEEPDFRFLTPQPQSQMRAGAKLGRNEPCPCGSGRKTKKCCGDSAQPALVSLLPPLPAPEVHRRPLGDRQFERLDVCGMARFPVALMTDGQLGVATRTFLDRRLWPEAEHALLSLIARDGDLGGRYAADFLDVALDAGAHAVVERVLPLVASKYMDTVTRLHVAMVGGSATLADLETAVAEALRDEETGGCVILDLAHVLLRYRSPLGVLATRAVRGFDEVEGDILRGPFRVAKASLGLSPVDEFSGDVPEHAVQENAAAPQEAPAARADGAEMQQLRAQLDALQSEVSAARAQAAAANPQQAIELRRARDKVKALEGLVRERTDRIGELERERQTTGGHERAVARQPPVQGSPGAPSEDSHFEVELPVEGARRRVLVPVIQDHACAALVEVPQAIASAALALIARLASGEAASWSGVKALVSAERVLSARVGLHYRLLFSVEPEGRTLAVLELCPRRELENAIRRHRARR